MTGIIPDKYINPLTDFGFKKLFGSEPNKDLLIDFLNVLLPSKHTIKNLTYTKNEHLGETLLDRKAIFDIYCESVTGEKFIVEVQKAKQTHFKDRSIYYATFPVQEQAKRGDWDFKLAAVYTISILDFIFEDHTKDSNLIHVVELKNQDGEVFYDKLKFIYIELPKFKKQENELLNRFDKWLFVFRHLAELQKKPESLQDRIFKKLFEAAEIAKFSLTDREAYQNSLKYYRDLKNVVDTSKEEGREEGIEVGIEVGIKKVAISMKQAGISNKVIAEHTGLTIGDIEEL
ncbi:MAG: Rpn family recombination-promoting nuclease/putative transposase [Chitinophagales bacterium]